MSTYRGKYPQRIKSVSFGTSKTWFIESNDGQRVTLTSAQCRAIFGSIGPKLGDDITACLQMPLMLDMIHTGRANESTSLASRNAYSAARDIVRTANDTGLAITVSASAEHLGFSVKDATNPAIRASLAIVTVLPRNYFA